MGDCKKASESCSSAIPTGSATNTAHMGPTRYCPRSGQAPNTTEQFEIPLPTSGSQFLILAPRLPFIGSECNRTEDASARGRVGAQHRAAHVMPPNVPPERIGDERLLAGLGIPATSDMSKMHLGRPTISQEIQWWSRAPLNWGGNQLISMA